MKIIRRIFSPLVLTISILLLIYTIYKSEIYWDGNKRNYYLIYYIISSILIFFAFISFFINQKIKDYIIITFTSVVMGLYLFEGYLAFKEQNTKNLISKEQILKEELYEKQTGDKWDRRSKFEIYEDLKRENNEIVMAVAPREYKTKYDTIFSLSGISNSETIYCNESGFYSFYQSDRYGFNNPDVEWNNKEIEYLLVGDSFAHGACVNRPNDISSVLRILSNKSVLNLGQGGNAPLIEYASLREYLKPNVKKVLWLYFEGNDIDNLAHELSNDILINYLNNINFTQNLKLRQKEINNLKISFLEKRRKEEREKESFKFNLQKFIKIYNTRLLIYKGFAPVPNQDPILAFKKILKLTKELTSKNNSKLYFVYLPEFARYKTNYDNSNLDLIKNIVTNLEIPFINISKEVFEKEESPLKLFPFEQWGHYNIEGYKKVGETIYKFTKN